MSPMSADTRIEVRVKEQACTRCGICMESCPIDVLRADERGVPYLAYQEDCEACFLCEIDCPREAIQVGFVGVQNAYRLTSMTGQWAVATAPRPAES